jgi:hypothetical protein
MLIVTFVTIAAAVAFDLSCHLRLSSPVSAWQPLLISFVLSVVVVGLVAVPAVDEDLWDVQDR